jgi:hypothetical protein
MIAYAASFVHYQPGFARGAAAVHPRTRRDPRSSRTGWCSTRPGMWLLPPAGEPAAAPRELGCDPDPGSLKEGVVGPQRHRISDYPLSAQGAS